MSLPVIAFIGAGVMGRGMAANLLAAGHPVIVNTRTRASADTLLSLGATWADTPAEAASRADVIVTIVGYPKDVEQVWCGPSGVFEGVKRGALCIDMTTSSASLAKTLAARAAGLGVDMLDAPVSGGDIGAREARLSIMVGGEKTAFERALPVFQKMGKTIVLQGPAGSGQYCKMCNQIAIAGGMLALAESLSFAKASGLTPAVVLENIGGGAAGSWALANLAPRVIRGDYAPGFFVKHFVKDMRITLEAARESGIRLPGLELAERLYSRLVDEGGGDFGTQALIRIYEAHPANPASAS